jgi:hypothetical protein
MATYTAVLLSNTVAPSWHQFYGKMSFAFGGSATTADRGDPAARAHGGPARTDTPPVIR